MTRPAPAGPTVAGEERAWGWVAHLRDGGTTPWLEWYERGQWASQWASQSPTRSRGRYLPGAQQMELLRRLNAAGRPAVDLADRVLAASAAGRGRPDLELSGAGPESSFGPAPVDPAGLPAGELVRVAASVLADELVDQAASEADRPAGGTVLSPPGPDMPRPAARRLDPRWARASWWRRGYRLVGDPELSDPLRARMVARGRPPGGREPRILVLGTDVATMAAHAWTHRAFTEGVNAWREWLRQMRERRELPARLDLLTVARNWERRVGHDRVHVVLDPSAVPRLLRDRRTLATRAAWPATLPGECGELSRRVGSVLGLLVLPEQRQPLLSDLLRPRVTAAAARAGGGRPLVVPPAHREWVEAAAEKMREGIRSAGYAVHGDLATLVPRWPADGDLAEAGPSPGATLDLAIRVLLDDPTGRTR